MMIVETTIDDPYFDMGTRFVVDSWEEDGMFIGFLIDPLSGKEKKIECHCNFCKIIEE